MIACLSFEAEAAITGYWTFEQQDLAVAAQIGQQMFELDDPTSGNEQFGRTAQAPFVGVPNINGQQASFLKFPKTGPTGGYNVPHSAVPNGGGSGINQYTIIMDVLFPGQAAGAVADGPHRERGVLCGRAESRGCGRRDFLRDPCGEHVVPHRAGGRSDGAERRLLRGRGESV